MTERASVPCAGCTACCYGLVVLHSALGDDYTQYEVEPYHGVMALKRLPDGSCFYLDDGECSIHDRAPAVCRAFDCRVWAKTKWPELGEPQMAAQMLAAAKERE